MDAPKRTVCLRKTNCLFAGNELSVCAKRTVGFAPCTLEHYDAKVALQAVPLPPFGIPDVYPKRRSWILAFSRKERKERKVYRDGGILEEFQINPPF